MKLNRWHRDFDFTPEEKRERAEEIHANLEENDPVIIKEYLPEKNLFKGMIAKIIEKINENDFRIELLFDNDDLNKNDNTILIIDKKYFIPLYTASDPILGKEILMDFEEVVDSSSSSEDEDFEIESS